MNQSVLDELEFLDLGGFDNGKSGEEADFDFVYHLPHAAEDRIVLHNSISDFGFIEQFKKSELGSHPNLAEKQHSSTNMHRKKLSRALDPFFNGKKETIRSKFKHAIDGSASRIGGSRLLSGSQEPSAQGSKMSLARSLQRRQSFMPMTGAKRPSLKPPAFGVMDDSEFDEGDVKITVNGQNLGSGVQINVENTEESNPFIVSVVPPTPMAPVASELRRRSTGGVVEDEFPPAPTDASRSTLARSNPALHDKSNRTLDLNNSFNRSLKHVPSPEVYNNAVDEIEKEKAKAVKKPAFHALPLFISRVPPKIVAFTCLIVVAIVGIYVLTDTIILATRGVGTVNK